MDDISQHLSPQQLAMFNNVRIYLHITMLLELTHSNGTQLLKHLLECNTEMLPSMLVWLHQDQPPNEAWCMWESALHQMYTKGPTSMLLQPLNLWLPETTDLYWQWEGLVCPTSLTLY